MKQKMISLSSCLTVLSIICLAFGVISLIACHQNVSAQLSQGISVEGNELAILNLYLQSSASYFVYAVLLYAIGRLYHLRYVESTDIQIKDTDIKEAQEDVYYQENDLGDTIEYHGFSD